MQLRDFTHARALTVARQLGDRQELAMLPARTTVEPPAKTTDSSRNPSPRAVGIAIALGIIIGGGGGVMLDIAALAAVTIGGFALILRVFFRPRGVSEALAQSPQTARVMTAYSPPPSGSGFARLIVRTALVAGLLGIVFVAVLDRDGALNDRVRQLAAAYVGPATDPGGEAQSTPSQASGNAPAAYDAVRELTFRKQANGHFFITAEVNGSPIQFLVDSGASHIVLTQQDAQRVGLRPNNLRYDGRTQTANGVAAYANVDLRQVRIGQLAVYDVDATVVDSPLNISLLGMSFLSELDGFEVRGDRLILRY